MEIYKNVCPGVCLCGIWCLWNLQTYHMYFDLIKVPATLELIVLITLQRYNYIS